MKIEMWTDVHVYIFKYTFLMYLHIYILVFTSRWGLQHNVPVLPKSITPRRIEENFNIFDFELTIAEMKEIDTLDRGKKYCWDPVTVV